MAHPIAFEAAPKPDPVRPERLQNAPAEHAEALLSAYEVLQVLHDKGVLNLVRGLVGGGDALIGTVSAALDTPESIRGIRNFVLLSKFFANIPSDVLTSLAETVSNGAKREKAHKPPGLLHLFRRLRNGNTRHAAAVALDLLEGLGKAL
jgi:uncharacterized protein YjgD (DUF1641 family)